MQKTPYTGLVLRRSTESLRGLLMTCEACMILRVQESISSIALAFRELGCTACTIAVLNEMDS
jgi:hypothetical protein